MRLYKEVAKNIVGKYIDRVRKTRRFPMKIVESNGELCLIDNIGIMMPIPDKEDDFNCETYDFVIDTAVQEWMRKSHERVDTV